MATKKKKKVPAKKIPAKKKPSKKPDPSRIKRTLITAMKAVEAKGLHIDDGSWGVDMNDEKGYFTAIGQSVCALGALLVYKNGSIKFDAFRGQRPLADVSADETAAYILGVDAAWVDAFIGGFDGDDRFGHDAEIGWDIDTQKYLPKRACTAKQLELREAFEMGLDLADRWDLAPEKGLDLDEI